MVIILVVSYSVLRQKAVVPEGVATAEQFELDDLVNPVDLEAAK